MTAPLKTSKPALGEDKAKRISWRENEEEGEFDVREVIGILTALDASSYPHGSSIHPITAYSGKEACLKRFKESRSVYEKLYGIASDALEMWDWIQYYLPGQYNDKGPEPGTSGKFGGLTGIKTLPNKPKKLPFARKTTEYDTPSGYIYPVIGSFRAMLEEKNGIWTWGKGINPLKLIQDGVAADIFINSVRVSIGVHRNPNRTGKDSQAWTSAYQQARIAYLELPNP